MRRWLLNGNNCKFENQLFSAIGKLLGYYTVPIPTTCMERDSVFKSTKLRDSSLCKLAFAVANKSVCYYVLHKNNSHICELSVIWMPVVITACWVNCSCNLEVNKIQRQFFPLTCFCFGKKSLCYHGLHIIVISVNCP